MKGPVIDQIVYNFMFPKPKSTDPPNFQGLLQRQLVPEVRLETQAFYGHLSSQEAKYPGLDYSYQPHRARLSRYPWHRRLFRAFDNLGLTESEIAGLTKWEGTRWAKERFEREQGILIRDTTADGIADWVEPRLRVPARPESSDRQEEMEGIEELNDDSQAQEQDSGPGLERDEDVEEDLEEFQDDERDAEIQVDEDGDEDSDFEIQSVGVALNERLRAAVAQREAGNPSTVIDEEWEQWFKDAVEAGGLPFLSPNFSPHANFPGTRPEVDSQSSIPPRLLNAARMERWHQIPNVLHQVIRQNTENHTPNNTNSNTPVENSRRNRDTLDPQQPLASSSILNSSTRAALTPPFHHRSNMFSQSRRLNSNSMTEVNSRMRQWESQRITMGTNQTPRMAHVSAIRSTQNQTGNSSIS